MADLIEEFGDRVGFVGLLIDFDNRALAVSQLEGAGADFLNVHSNQTQLQPIVEAIRTGFVPSAGIFNPDGSIIGVPIRGGVPGYRTAIEAVLGR